MVKGIATNYNVISLMTGPTVCTRQITDSSFYPIISDIKWMDKTDNEKHFAELLRLKVKGVINRKKKPKIFLLEI